MHRFSLLVVAVLSACQTPYSSKFQNEEGGFPEPSILLKNAHGAHQQLASVGRLQAGMNCTAFLWKPSGAEADAPALAVTSGHCVMPYADRASSYEVWMNQPASSDWKLHLHYFVDTPDARKTVPVRSIVYATMKSVDLALLALNVSWADLEREGLRPLRTAPAPARAGTPIRTVGLAEGDVPAAEQFLREAHCVEETRASIVEWFWAWFDTHRNSCADIREGSSGSPVLNDKGEVYAVIHTTSASSISDSCYLGQPCEMQRPGAVMVANKNYAIDIVGLDRCFQGQALRLGSRCPLPPPLPLAYADAPLTPTRPVDQHGQPLHWALKANHSLWKFGAVGEVDCRDDDDYQSGPLPTSALPQDHGVYLICLQKPDADARFPTVVVLSIDTRPPALKPQLSIKSSGSGLTVEPVLQVPELSLYQVGFGPAGHMLCRTLALAPYRGVPLRLDRRDLPATVCIQGADHAGNRGPIFDHEVTAKDLTRLRLESGSRKAGSAGKASRGS